MPIENVLRNTEHFFVKNSISLIALLISFLAYRHSKSSLSYKKKIDFAEKRGLLFSEILQLKLTNDEILFGLDEVNKVLDCVSKLDNTQITATDKKVEDEMQNHRNFARKIQAMLNHSGKLNEQVEPYEYEKLLHDVKDLSVLLNTVLKKLSPMIESARTINDRLMRFKISEELNRDAHKR